MPEDGSGRAGAQRATGQASVRLGTIAGTAFLLRLRQSGSAKAFLPRVHGPVPEVVFLNTAGGLTGGDSLGFSLTLEAGTRAVGTTQTAERAYASAGGQAAMEVRLTLGDSAALDWLPQETILFDRSALARRTIADLGSGARLLIAETVVLGRAAMGETLRDVTFTDWRCVRRATVPVLLEPLRITEATLGAGPAALGAARAFATVALIGAGAQDGLDAARAALPDGVEAAASGWDGKLVVRIVGPDLFPVKRAVARVLGALRDQPLPRVWQM